ncbi:Crp/Fnr family transcriptional regulator [Nonomuraea sp. NPDC000554]|uniref:Crp/Fnr family transcriptional regulator n=1 Tax=Nonomuraea sp. NPDC000554 TaxID=3154259 RepID=UPI00331EA1B8
MQWWPTGTLMAVLDERARAEFLALGEPQRFDTGEVIIRQGDPSPDRVYLLRSARTGTCACAKVTANLGTGVETLLGIRVSGDLVGEMGVLRGVERSATVTACSPTVAFRIAGKAFLDFLDRNPHIGTAVAAMIADRLQWANQRRLDFAAFDVPVRLARVIGELAGRHGIERADGTDLGVSLSQQELGRLIGARDAAVGKAMRALREGGVLRTSYRRLVITDPDRLRILQSAD